MEYWCHTTMRCFGLKYYRKLRRYRFYYVGGCVTSLCIIMLTLLGNIPDEIDIAKLQLTIQQSTAARVGFKATKESETLRVYFTPRPDSCDDCFHTNFKLLLGNANVCKHSGGFLPYLLILITSKYAHNDSRTAIRETWATHALNNNVSYVFVFGNEPNVSGYLETLKQENDIHRDLVVYDFIDSYDNLTIKTMMGLKYASTRCPYAKFVMKTDDDVYVNLPAVLKLLMPQKKIPRDISSIWLHQNKQKTNMTKLIKSKNNKPDRQVSTVQVDDSISRNVNIETKEMKKLFGLRWEVSKPIRNNSGENRKWFVSEMEYPAETYPDYFDGHGYIIDMSATHEIVKASRNVPFFRFEDVYIGLCMGSLGYRLSHTEGFTRTIPWSDRCFHKFMDIYTVHGISAKSMKKLYEEACPSSAEISHKQARMYNHWIKVQKKSNEAKKEKERGKGTVISLTKT